MSNKHKHHELISQWNDDNSIEFEFAYGTGVDFTWHDCDITRVINSPLSQIRIKAKKPNKEKRWIAFNHENGNVYGTFLSEDKCKMAWPNLQKLQIEVEV